jgi:molybdenum cofactor cytidylyltransferase
MMDSTGAEGSNVIAGLVLAAGSSVRFSRGNKLLTPVAGVPLARRTVENYVDAGLDEVVVVTGYHAVSVEEALAGLPLRFVRNLRFQQGQSRSLQAGLAALSARAAAAIIGVADQPYLSPLVIKAIASRYQASGERLIVPRYAGQRGNPVLFAASLFPELMRVEGDIGGRPVLKAHADEICWLDFPQSRWASDVDTVEDLSAL